MGDDLPFQSKCTALHKAAKKGDAEIVAPLLGRGAAVTNSLITSVGYMASKREKGLVQPYMLEPRCSWPCQRRGLSYILFIFAADVNIVDVSQFYMYI